MFVSSISKVVRFHLTEAATSTNFGRVSGRVDSVENIARGRTLEFFGCTEPNRLRP